MSSTYTTNTEEMLLLAETLGEIKLRTEKLEHEFATQARPIEAATHALKAALEGIKSVETHVIMQELAALRAEVEQLKTKI